MRKIKKRLVAWLNSPKKDLVAIQETLSSLERDMREISEMENKVEAIIRLFQVISPLQDKSGFSTTISALEDKNYGQLGTELEALQALQRHISNAGRDEGGMNRTKLGEPVTPEKVFLGGIQDIWTFPASHWLADQKKCEGEIIALTVDADRPVTTWTIIHDHQAGGFVESHTNGILEQIEVLQKAAA
jgi:hypothetical protein